MDVSFGESAHEFTWSIIEGTRSGGPWHAIVSSRLGRPVERYRGWFCRLQRALMRVRRDGGKLVVLDGTTTASWVLHGAKLFGVPTVRLAIEDQALRDVASILLADKVLTLHVRPGGQVEACLLRRLQGDYPAGSVWVSVGPGNSSAERQLIAKGAVAWYCGGDARTLMEDGTAEDAEPPQGNEPQPAEADRTGAVRRVSWRVPARLRSLPASLESDQWLVHCTRGRSGPLPGQSDEQWRDEVLLGGARGVAWGPEEVLREILRTQWLRGSPLRNESPAVVCFSAVGLGAFLARRRFRAHLGRWDYEPYGIAIRREVLMQRGAMPVIYGAKTDYAAMMPEQRWRFQSRGTTFDWTEEQEWRLRGGLDLRQLGDDDAVVFVGEPSDVPEIVSVSRWPVILGIPTRFWNQKSSQRKLQESTWEYRRESSHLQHTAASSQTV